MYKCAEQTYGFTLLILLSMQMQRLAALPLGGKAPSTSAEAEWAPQPILMLRIRDKFLGLAGN
jgi:hypothetical protein